MYNERKMMEKRHGEYELDDVVTKKVKDNSTNSSSTSSSSSSSSESRSSSGN